MVFLSFCRQLAMRIADIDGSNFDGVRKASPTRTTSRQQWPGKARKGQERPNPENAIELAKPNTFCAHP
jgi:hypothetical protein